MRTEWRDGARTHTVDVVAEGAGRYRVTVDGAEIRLVAQPLDGGRLRLVTPDGATTAEVTVAGARRFVRLGAMDFVFEREPGGRRASRAADGGLEAPMPGVVTRVLVAQGESVRRGQALIAVEAMKMEHLVRAPRDGQVKAVRVKTGEMVGGGATLLELDDAASPEA